MRRRNRWLLVGGVLVALLSIVAVVIWNIASSPEVTTFYDQPETLAGTTPGTLIRWEPMESRDGNSVWRILYVSTDLHGEPIPVSGLIAVPPEDAPEGGYPLLAVAHGTTGVARGCAPSLMLYDGSDAMPSLYSDVVEPFLDAGYAVVMTDYQGLGAAGSPSYVIGQIEGQNVLDSVRAARAFAEISLSEQLLLHGHSQGGHAAAFTMLLAPEYAPELAFDGVVLSAPATNLAGMFESILNEDERSPITALVLYVAQAWSGTYPEASLDQVTTRLGQEAIDTVIDNTCLTVSALASTFVAPSRLILPGATTTWADLLQQNTPEPGPWNAPVFIAQGEADGVIAPGFTAAYVEALCASGITVGYHTYPDATHFSVAGASEEDVLAWMEERLSGDEAPSTCTGGR